MKYSLYLAKNGKSTAVSGYSLLKGTDVKNQYAIKSILDFTMEYNNADEVIDDLCKIKNYENYRGGRLSIAVYKEDPEYPDHSWLKVNNCKVLYKQDKYYLDNAKQIIMDNIENIDFIKELCKFIGEDLNKQPVPKYQKLFEVIYLELAILSNNETMKLYHSTEYYKKIDFLRNKISSILDDLIRETKDGISIETLKIASFLSDNKDL